MEAAPNPCGDIPLVEPAARGLIGYEVLIRQELPERRIHPEHPGVLVRPQAGRAHYGWDSVQELADPLLGIGLILLQDALDSRWRCQFHRSEEHTSELQSLMRISYAVFCLKKQNTNINRHI